MAWNLDFGLWQSIAAIKKARQYSIVISPDPNERMLVELRMKRAYLWRPRARRREHRYFTPRRDSSSSACRPNARDAALLHVPQLGVHGARSTGCPDLGSFVRRDKAVRTREFLCAMSLPRRRSFGLGRIP